VAVVLVEVEEHQPPVEERADQRSPTGRARERLVGVAQGLGTRVRTEQDGPAAAHEVHLGDRAECVVLVAHHGQRVAQVGEGATDVGQSAPERGVAQQDGGGGPGHGLSDLTGRPVSL
jgi:hypothetical protein